MTSVNRIIIHSDKKFFLKVDTTEDNNCDKLMKITITNGQSVWESTKLSLKDLVNLKPEGIEESVQSSAISLAFFGNNSNESELKEEDLLIEFTETGSGNLNFGWKLKQSYGITVLLGAILLLKQSPEDSQSKIITLLEETVAASDLRSQLKESLEFNKKMVEDFEKIVKGKLEEEEELYTKFRILLNQKN